MLPTRGVTRSLPASPSWLALTSERARATTFGMDDEANDNDDKRQRDKLRLEFEASRAQHRAGALGWADYGLTLTSICERCSDNDCVDACAGSVTLAARLGGRRHLQKGVTDEIRELEK